MRYWFLSFFSLSILFVTPASEVFILFFSSYRTAVTFTLIKERRWIGAPPLSDLGWANALACMRRTHARTHVRCVCAKKTPKRVNTDNYAFHASAHTSKFHLIPLTAKPASFFIPPRARTVLLSCSSMRDRSLHVHLEMKKNREVLAIYYASAFFLDAYTYIHLQFFNMKKKYRKLIQKKSD